MRCLACGTDDRPIVRFTPNGVVEACSKCTAPIVAERPIANGAFLANASPHGETVAVSETAPSVQVEEKPRKVAQKVAKQEKPKDFLASARARLVEVRRQLKALEKLQREEAAICMLLDSVRDLERQKAKH